MSQYPECRHVMPTGRRCQSPAMRGSLFCYFHGRSQRAARPSRPLENPFGMSVVLEAETAQQAINEVLQALACNSISNRRAQILLDGIRLAKAQSPRGAFELTFADDDLPAESAPPEPGD